ncbi:MAG: FCD domain-containing protein, partial [Pseudomonadota bacterium]
DVLKGMMETVNVHLEVLRLRTVVLAGRAQQSVREHIEIVEAVEKGDAAGAEELMRRHVKSVQRDALRHIDLMV